MKENKTRFDHLVATLLTKNGGIFLGEDHDDPSIEQSVTKLLPFFRAHGVGTVSVELPGEVIQAAEKAKAWKDLASQYPGLREKGMKSLYELVQAAEKLDIKVLGHEKPVSSEMQELYWHHLKSKKRTPEQERRWRALIDQLTSDDGVRERDDWAKRFIEKNQTGKVIVIGGKGHSGNYKKGDLKFGEWEVSTTNDYQGLDVKLGYPSIDYRYAVSTATVGDTRKTDGRLNNFTVDLPIDLVHLNTTSWPLPRGIPSKPRTTKSR